MRRRYVTIGSGPAAVSAVETIRSLDPGGEIVIVCAEPHGYYSRPGLAYYLAGEVPEKRLFPFGPEDFARLDVQLVFKRAVDIDVAGHTVTLEDGRSLSYDRLLLATGARAIPVRVPGGGLEGVVKLDDLADARGLIRRSRRAKAAVVVGGGITALEIVEGLRAHDVHVHYFMRQDRYWSNVLSEEESRLVERGLESRGVQVHYFTELAGILGRKNRVAAVQTKNGEEIPADEHKGDFGQDCSQCHSADDWANATFDHSKSKFPLTGAHADVDCDKCHVNGEFKGTVTDCVSCHEEPGFHANAFGTQSTQCAACHTTTAWTPAEFSLAHNAIPIDHGAEEQVPGCKTCHPTDVNTYSCYGCHEHTESRIQGQHEGRPAAELADCIRCHPGGRGGD